MTKVFRKIVKLPKTIKQVSNSREIHIQQLILKRHKRRYNQKKKINAKDGVISKEIMINGQQI